MADQVKISNFPDSGSAERVAYDLMNRIVGAEVQGGHKVKPPELRNYYLSLYGECLHVVRHGFQKGE